MDLDTPAEDVMYDDEIVADDGVEADADVPMDEGMAISVTNTPAIIPVQTTDDDMPFESQTALEGIAVETEPEIVSFEPVVQDVVDVEPAAVEVIALEPEVDGSEAIPEEEVAEAGDVVLEGEGEEGYEEEGYDDAEEGAEGAEIVEVEATEGAEQEPDAAAGDAAETEAVELPATVAGEATAPSALTKTTLPEADVSTDLEADYAEADDADLELEPLAPILLHTSGGTHALFSPPDYEEGGEQPSIPILLAGRDDLADQGLDVLFRHLRAGLMSQGIEVPGEMVVTEKEMQLNMGEDDINLANVTLLDLLALHEGCGLPTPVQLFIKSEPHRFITRFEAIRREVEAANERELSEEGMEGEGVEGEWEEEYAEDVGEEGEEYEEHVHDHEEHAEDHGEHVDYTDEHADEHEENVGYTEEHGDGHEEEHEEHTYDEGTETADHDLPAEATEEGEVYEEYEEGEAEAETEPAPPAVELDASAEDADAPAPTGEAKVSELEAEAEPDQAEVQPAVAAEAPVAEVVQLETKVEAATEPAATVSDHTADSHTAEAAEEEDYDDGEEGDEYGIAQIGDAAVAASADEEAQDIEPVVTTEVEAASLEPTIQEEDEGDDATIKDEDGHLDEDAEHDAEAQDEEYDEAEAEHYDEADAEAYGEEEDYGEEDGDSYGEEEEVYEEYDEANGDGYDAEALEGPAENGELHDAPSPRKRTLEEDGEEDETVAKKTRLSA